jgi:hypothetical protein
VLLQVSLLCGTEEHLKQVEEPSRCEYVAHLSTPAACSKELAQQLQQQIEQADRDLAPHDEL